MIDEDRPLEPAMLEVRLPPFDGESPVVQEAVMAIADAAGGDTITRPAADLEGWRTIAHLAAQIPGTTITVTLPTGGTITSDG